MIALCMQRRPSYSPCRIYHAAYVTMPSAMPRRSAASTRKQSHDDLYHSCTERKRDGGYLQEPMCRKRRSQHDGAGGNASETVPSSKYSSEMWQKPVHTCRERRGAKLSTR